MKTEAQKVLLALLDEIIDICRERDLHYVLAEEMAVQAREFGAFVDEACDVIIAMPLSDIDELQKAVREKQIAHRAFESWENNPQLPRPVFRYVNTATTMIDGQTGQWYELPGLAVTIVSCIRRAQSPAMRAKSLALNILADGTELNPRLADAAERTRTNALRLVKRSQSRMPWASGGKPDALAKGLLNDFRARNDKPTGTYHCITNLGLDIKLPADFFTGGETVTFEGRELLLPGGMDEYLEHVFAISAKGHPYLRSLYGTRGWQKRSADPLLQGNGYQVICEASVPFADYLSYLETRGGPALAEVLREVRDYNHWLVMVHDPAKRKSEFYFAQVRRSVDRIDIWYELKPRRAELAAAVEAHDVELLAEILEDYLEATEKYRKKGIGFYIDDDVFEAAKLVWEANGKKPAYAEKVYSLVPELYRTETVDMYLESRGL